VRRLLIAFGRIKLNHSNMNNDFLSKNEGENYRITVSFIGISLSCLVKAFCKTIVWSAVTVSMQTAMQSLYAISLPFLQNSGLVKQ